MAFCFRATRTRTRTRRRTEQSLLFCHALVLAHAQRNTLSTQATNKGTWINEEERGEKKKREKREKREKRKVVVIAGPTGVGKTQVSLALARLIQNQQQNQNQLEETNLDVHKVEAEIISADSVQVYRGLDVGSRKVSRAMQCGVSHHLIDVLPPTQQYSAGDFYSQAREKTEEILKRGNVPVVVGGTGFWLRWYVKGRPTTPKSNESTRKRAQELIQQAIASSSASSASASASDEKPQELELVELVEKKEKEEEEGRWANATALLEEAGDAETAARLSKNDYFRLERALEIVLSTGMPLRKHLNVSRGFDFDFRCFFLYPRSRHALYQRLDLSCEDMIMNGLLEESVSLLNAGLLPGESTAANAVGYKQFMEYFLKMQEQKEEEGSKVWRPCYEDFITTVWDFQKVNSFSIPNLSFFLSSLLLSSPHPSLNTRPLTCYNSPFEKKKKSKREDSLRTNLLGLGRSPISSGFVQKCVSFFLLLAVFACGDETY